MPTAVPPEVLTYLTDSTEPKPGQPAPRVGDPVELRRRRDGREIEAWSVAGNRLGRLPPAEREALDGLIACDAPMPTLLGRISAVVPRPLLAGGGRIHIRVTAPSL